MRIGLLLMFCCTVLTSGGAPAELAEWTEFRGPTGQGIAGAAPRSWGKDEGVAWRIPIEEQGWSSPLVSGGKIVLTGASGEGAETKLSVLALDLVTGDELWSREVFSPSEDDLAARHGKNSFASATPVIRDGMIYAHFGHMGTAALTLERGEVVWKKKISYEPKHGGASSPILVDDLVVFSADGEKDPMLVALHAKTGDLAWKTFRNTTVRQQFSFCTPLLVEHEGRRVIVSPASGMIGGYAPEDGTLLWTVDGGDGFSVVPRPVVLDGMVYAASGFMKPRLLAIRLGGEGDVTKSHLAWEEEKFIPKTPSFVAAGGVLYVLDDTGRVSCLDAGSGEVKWQEKLMGNFSASPVLAGGALYCCTEDGVCFVMEVSPLGGKVVLEIDLEERILASPAVVEEALLLRTETHLWKIVGG